MSKKVASMLAGIKATLSDEEIRTLQEMLNQDSFQLENVSLEDVMAGKRMDSPEAPQITQFNYQGFESDPRFGLIAEGMKVLEEAERKEDWAEIKAAKAKYPRAAAFIAALLVATAAGESRHEAGIRAMDRLLNEDPVEDVLRELWDEKQ